MASRIASSFTNALWCTKYEVLHQNRFGTCWSLDFFLYWKRGFFLLLQNMGKQGDQKGTQWFSGSIGFWDWRLASASAAQSSHQSKGFDGIVVVSLQRFIFLFWKRKPLCYACHFWKGLWKLMPFYRNSFRLLIDTVGQNCCQESLFRFVVMTKCWKMENCNEILKND